MGAVTWTSYFRIQNAARYNPTTGVATILPGKIVYLNETPTFDISLLIVQGSLVFDHCYDLELAASSILVIWDGVVGSGNGVLQIGKSDLRFPHDATIKLRTWPFGSPPPEIAANLVWSTEIKDALSDRGLVVANGGTLRLYGQDRDESWTKLAQTAGIGATTLTTISSTLPWGNGDEVVIASTDFDQSQAETRILSPPINGQLEFSTVLSQMHYGEVQNFAPVGVPPSEIALWSVDERAEVGLLNRNVKILGEQSTPSGADPENFGHVFFYRDVGAALPNVEISWVEFRDLGIAGKPARYPVHFHMLKDPGTITNFIEYSSIREGHNRGLVIHDSQEIRAQGNVVYDVVGYGVYVEDKDTVNCEILDNLSLSNHKLTADVYSPLIDQDPSNFALRSLDNHFVGNVAAGSASYGIYLDLYNLVPYTPAGMLFSGNSAHSCQKIGIFEDNELNPTTLITFAASRVWKCREYGMWIRSIGDYLVNGLEAADCRSGFYPASKGLREAGEGSQVLSNGLFVGETANLGKPVEQIEIGQGRSLPQLEPDLYAGEPNRHELAWDTLNGVEIYDGFIEITNCRFAEFVDRNLGGYGNRWAAGLTQVAKVSTWINDPRNRVSGLSFDDSSVPRRAHFRTTATGNNQIAFTTIIDKDGSLGYGANTILMPDTPFLTWDEPAGSHHTLLNGYSVSLANGRSYGQLAVRLNNINPQNPLNDPLQRTSWLRVEDPAGTVGAPGLGDVWLADTVPTSIDFGGDNAFVFPLVVEVGADDLPPADVLYYRMGYHSSISSDFPSKLRVSYRFAPYVEIPNLPDEPKVVFLEIPYDDVSGPSAVTYRNMFGATLPVTPVGSLGSLLIDPAPQAYSWSGTRLYLKFTSQVKDGESAEEYGSQVQFEIIG